MRYGNPVHRLAHLLRLLYIPDGDLEPEELDAAEELALPPVPVPVPVPGFDRAAALYHMMLPPPNMQGFSSLEVLQLPGSIRSSWWMVCSEPDHWEALAGCRALRQLEGLHACRPPPAGVEFPGVTRLEVTVAPGDAVQVLAAFPALRQLKLTSVLLADQVRIASDTPTMPTMHSVNELARYSISCCSCNPITNGSKLPRLTHTGLLFSMQTTCTRYAHRSIDANNSTANCCGAVLHALRGHAWPPTLHCRCCQPAFCMPPPLLLCCSWGPC